jgi:hypothetical protein
MESETDPRVLDALLKARRIARRAELIEIARGRQPWWKWILPGAVLLVVAYLTRSSKPDLWWGILATLFVASWLDKQLDRRLDAVLEILSSTREHAES